MTEQDRVFEAIEAGCDTHNAIVRVTGINPSSARQYIGKLIAAGRVKRTLQGRHAFYRVIESTCLLAEAWH